MGVIYQLHCSATNKVYIGQTVSTAEKRWKQHVRDAHKNREYLAGNIEAPHNKRGMCSKLYRAINAHGAETFTITTLVVLPNDELDAVETRFIAGYNSVAEGYNLKAGGDSSPHSPETIARMQIINATNMQTTFTKFRKHEVELENLPIHCIYLQKRGINGYAIHKHPNCPHREFTEKKYGTLENAKHALIEFLAKLESGETAVQPLKKREDTLPKGVRRLKNGYFVDKQINGIHHRKAFSKDADDSVNRANAIAHLNSLINLA